MRYRLRTLLVSITAGVVVMALGILLALVAGELLGPLLGHRRVVTVGRCVAVMAGLALACYLGVSKSMRL